MKSRIISLIYMFLLVFIIWLSYMFYSKINNPMDVDFNLNTFILQRSMILLSLGLVTGLPRLIQISVSRSPWKLQPELILFLAVSFLLGFSTVFEINLVIDFLQSIELNITLLSIICQFFTGFILTLIFTKDIV